jgi:hypothetical protein
VQINAEVWPTADLFSAILLLGVCCFALFAALLLSALRAPTTSHERWFVGLVGAGALYLGLDELFGLHELVGKVVGQERVGGGFFTYVDDVVYAAYVVPVLVFLYCFRDILRRNGRLLGLLGGAAVLYVASIAIDARALGDRLEDAVELLSAAAIAGALGGTLLLVTRDALRPHAAIAAVETVTTPPAPSLALGATAPPRATSSAVGSRPPHRLRRSS